jgi:hypothetical protein
MLATRRELSMTTTQQQPALRWMSAGLALTIAATVAPYVDRATGNVLADHIRDGYPAYTSARIDAAVILWLAILTAIGVLGIVGWVTTIWATRAGKGGARLAATTMFTLGTLVALTALLVKDTSGDTGLAPLLGWIGVLPSLPGAGAVAMLWRGPQPRTASA